MVPGVYNIFFYGDVYSVRTFTVVNVQVTSTAYSTETVTGTVTPAVTSSMSQYAPGVHPSFEC
jgi:hypothetical protein